MLEYQISSLVWTLYNIYFYMIIAYVLLSWVPNARDSFIGQLLGRVTEPYLGIFRKFIPAIGGVIDISPIVAIFALRFIALGVEAVILFLIPG
ncbi:YggT family protein [Paenibacillus antri]|uniref:YggT family protein n=1 Tax=Paenibacillus antri TaxID=2582848 RepID=A0A5R9GG87_9BACL|nr:YggT family protein [Paenibacillus antri]TLS50415.1 YggT family protein [Paenibacillus antri]